MVVVVVDERGGRTKEKIESVENYVKRPRLDCVVRVLWNALFLFCAIYEYHYDHIEFQSRRVNLYIIYVIIYDIP